MSKRSDPDRDAFDNPWSDGEAPTSPPEPSQAHDGSSTDRNTDAPPSYSGPSETTRVVVPNPPTPLVPGMPNIIFSKYRVPDATLSKDQSTLTTTFAAFSSDPKALELFIREQAALPPRPLVRVTGTHTEMGQTKVDFDVRLNMMRYLLHPDEKWNFVKISPPEKKPSKGSKEDNDGLRDWAKRFCKDVAMIKSFSIQREVTNWNTDYIEGRIRSLLASIGYRGQVSVTFPVTHSQVVVQSAPKVNRFFTNILSTVVETKKYDVVKAYWPYATLGADASNPSGTASRSCAVQSEESWWKDWHAAIRCGVLARRIGWLSLEDQIELAMSPAFDVGEKIKDWGTDR